ncbi:hypothetical protein Tco_1004347 [Tanacetum coccineum]|uniref:Uncharacterized protein n=1 Tax=Tanacetum coccineum TaxID=301880 RepID=A0ABQ5FCS6_9ASTR
MSESAKRHEENSNLINEIRATIDAAIRNQGASIKTLEIQIGQMSKVLQERGFGSLLRSTKTNPRDQFKSISTTIEVDSHSIRRIGSSQYAVDSGIGEGLWKYPKGIAENILVGIGKFTFPLDFIILGYARGYQSALDPRKTIFVYRPRKSRGDLMPTIEEGEVIEEFSTRDEDLYIGIDGYPSYCDDDKKIHIDSAHNLKFSCWDNVVGALMNVPIFVGTFSVMTDFVVLEDMNAYHDEEWAILLLANHS